MQDHNPCFMSGCDVDLIASYVLKQFAETVVTEQSQQLQLPLLSVMV